MRRDHRPLALKQLARRIEAGYRDWFLRPQFDALGAYGLFMKPWYVNVHGPNIRLGDSVHVISAVDRRVSLTVWEHPAGAGAIDIGDYALLCPGVRIDSAQHIRIGRNTMLASGCYVTDADWHDLYDRSAIVGASAPVTLHENVWLGDGVTVCKGVTIGENSIVGAGSVVVRDIPANVIAAGNPAAPLKELDPARTLVTRAQLLADGPAVAQRTEAIDRLVHGGNGWFAWLRTVLRPGPDD